MNTDPIYCTMFRLLWLTSYAHISSYYLEPYPYTFPVQISVNAAIVSDSGGPCVCPHTQEDPMCLVDADYLVCVNEVRLDLITSTAAIAALSSCLLGFIANLPVAMAPGLGLNAYVRRTNNHPEASSSNCPADSSRTLLLGFTEPESSLMEKRYLPCSWKGKMITVVSPLKRHLEFTP